MQSTRKGSFSVHRRKKSQVPNTARQAASLPGDISRGRQSSMPQPKTRPDSPVPSLQGPCDRSQKSEVTCGSCLNWRCSLKPTEPTCAQILKPKSLDFFFFKLTPGSLSQRGLEWLPGLMEHCWGARQGLVGGPWGLKQADQGGSGHHPQPAL